MTPTLIIWFSLALKMAVTAAFVVVATIAAERSGPLIRGLITTLPISAGPVYIFLALDHNTQFLADTALGSLADKPCNCGLCVGLRAACAASCVACSASASHFFSGWRSRLLVHELPWTLTTAVLFNAIVLLACLVVARPYREAAIPRTPAHWSDIALRALAVAVLVAVVVALSVHIGPSATGILAVFPIVITSVMFILAWPCPAGPPQRA